MAAAFLETPVGMVVVEGDEKGISSIRISAEERTTSENIPPELQKAILQLKEYFYEGRKNFDFKLNPQGTDFQKKVWQNLQEIPFGKTISYLDLAKRLGDPKVIRAAASANGKNPLWVVVPCHRVIGSNGSLVGYAGGLPMKKWLLSHESSWRQESLF